jgi:hypothetical protein
VLRRSLFPSVLGLCLLAGAGCSDDSPDATPVTVPATSVSAQPSAAAGTQLVGTGFKIGLPAGWKQVDPTQDTSDLVVGSFGLKDGPNAELLKSLLVGQKKAGAQWAIASAGASGDFAPNLAVGCESGGLSGSTLPDLKKKAVAFNNKAKNLKITDVTISGKPAIQVSYVSTDLTGSTTESFEVKVPTGPEKYCYADLKARPGGLDGLADQIISTYSVS